MFWYIVVTIALESGVHVHRKVSHLFPHHTWRWVDIVIAKDNFQTLANVVIVDLICIDLVQHAMTTITHGTIVVVQDKSWPYIDRMLGIDFIPLVIGTYSCLHHCIDSSLNFGVHVSITCHQQTSLVPSMFISYYKQWVLIAFHHAQTITILQRVATLSHNFSSLPQILASAPLSLVNLWLKMPF
jgi:hypothetical protein